MGTCWRTLEASPDSDPGSTSPSGPEVDVVEPKVNCARSQMKKSAIRRHSPAVEPFPSVRLSHEGVKVCNGPKASLTLTSCPAKTISASHCVVGLHGKLDRLV